ncbi:MAG: hypothetical protein ACI8RZ_006133 [Myxococcota bacterium]|jgi:hypothetical protein
MLTFPDRVSTPQALITACNAAAATEPDGLLATLTGLGAPAAELVSTPISARIALLAAARGAAFFHHDLRGYIPMPPELEPEVEVDTVPSWVEGVREEPKYFSFFTESPLAPFNPNTRAKWRVHELLHGLVGFFWRPELTRFEAYLGARLCELLPVVHWYGYDEIRRPRCPTHAGQLLYRTHCRDCEARLAPYWRHTGGDPAIDLAAAQRAMAHFTEELDAAEQERRTGRRVITHRPRLDASSDAIGYLKGHWNRLTAWSFGAWVERFLIDGVDYRSSIAGLIEHLSDTHTRMLSGTIDYDPERAAILRARRVLQDVGYRSLLALEWIDPEDAAAQAIEPLLDAAGQLAGDAVRGQATAEALQQATLNLLDTLATHSGRFPEPVAAALPALGLSWWRKDAHIRAGAPILAEGLISAFPSALEDTDPVAAAEQLAADPGFETTASLRVRGGILGESVALEGWLNDLPRRDPDAELFAGVPEGAVPPESLRLNTTLRRRRFAATLVAELLDPSAVEAPFVDADGSVELCAVWWGGGARLIPLDAETAAAIDAVAAGEALSSESIDALVAAGVAVYLPGAA